MAKLLAMDESVRQLVSDTAALLGREAPGFMSADAMMFDAPASDSLYLIGLIGGKEVGKSSLVNAILGQSIVTPSSFGRGTSRATAYVHRNAEASLRTLLDRELPGQYDVVAHDASSARDRVVLDLPDIDSLWSEHVEITRKMLRFMLYPIWVQSIEKYADQQPMQLLKQVSEGNDPANFLFVLSKVDQLARRHGESSVRELTDDYAARLQRACALTRRPEVYGTSVIEPAKFDLESLRDKVLATRSREMVQQSMSLALRRQDQTALAWVREQNLPEKAGRLQRLLDEAYDVLNQRVGSPILEEALPRLQNDLGHRMSIAEPVARARLARWPVVNVLDAVLSPVMLAIRANVGSTLSQTLQETGRPLGDRLRGAFAELAQQDPLVLELYESSKPWEHQPATDAAADLLDRLSLARERQKEVAVASLSKKSILVTLFAPIITLGAILWFPLVQPILEIVLQNDITSMSRQTLLLIVQLLGATYLIKSIGFLAIYFIALWMFLRWKAYRQSEHWLRRQPESDSTTSNAAAPSPAVPSPALAVKDWIDALLTPIESRLAEVEALQKRYEHLTTRSAA